MNIKKRQKPRMIKRLEILASRLPKSYPKLQIIEKDITRLYKRYHLKKHVDYYLTYLSQDFMILYDIHLKNKIQFHIDTLILTPVALFIIQIEQLMNDKMTSKQIPHIKKQQIIHYLSKAKRAHINLTQWLKNYHYTNLPIYYLIALHNKTFPIIKFKNFNKNKVILAKHLPMKLNQYYNQLKQTKKHNKKEMKQIFKKICKKNKPSQFNLLAHYNINKSKIIPGVRCKQCKKLSMKRVNNVWQCPFCNYHLKIAHKDTINEYTILLNRPISKKECKWFLNINSTKTAKKLLADN